MNTSPNKAQKIKNNMIWIEGGTFTMGSNSNYPEEAPEHVVQMSGFWIDTTTITNRQFKEFVDETGYKTVAERPLDPVDYPGADPNLLVPGALVFQRTKGPADLRDYHNWWAYIPGAYWRNPEGPGSSIKKRMDHPVVQIAYEDAEAYAERAGKELPTEAQWEYAARGGLEGKTYVWGDTYDPQNKSLANTWEGEFPHENHEYDGFVGTAPVGSYPPNGYGLYDMAGNVWEWTNDWYREQHDRELKNQCCVPINQRATQQESSLDSRQPHIMIPRKVTKGGSHLCSVNYCLRYRPAARSAEMIDTGTTHIGFRLIKN